jgi:hypothetical protein
MKGQTLEIRKFGARTRQETKSVTLKIFIYDYKCDLLSLVSSYSSVIPLQTSSMRKGKR